MKVGFDGKRAANNLTGLGNYSRSLIEQLVSFFPQNRYFIYTPKIKSNPQIASFFSQEQVELKLPVKKSFLWRMFGIKSQLKDDDIDIFHGLSHELPYGIRTTGIPSIVTIHDLIFLKFPAYYKYPDRIIYTFKSRYACKVSDGIIAISETTKQDIIEHYHIPAEKIQVIYQSCDDAFKQKFAESRLQDIKIKYKLPEKYILNVGTIEDRKNLRVLIRALRNVPDSHILLVIGKEKPYAELVKREIKLLGLENRVKFLKNIPFADLPGIYQLADVFVYPSFYEGFGIPIIEALYSGVPVIAASGSCLEEAGGPSSLYFHPSDDIRLSELINQVINDPKKREMMVADGMTFVEKFDALTVSTQLMDYYNQISRSGLLTSKF
ncbi:glycosyltransferase family 4 protein [Pedobacter duraquae]|uniref:Glycosyltransferase involved in cell wall biosynthesis n=1 Tax=Pedobacter duraquae TaxID=425511 RepID=A0A4V3C3G7_9SPHI|nr:glycosyltransferase family 1 protein [Pedobacter duraquae]TDO22008.1 glycosyltransferase involved in cell wall biosynthesis [Pedobacter duraquae]